MKQQEVYSQDEVTSFNADIANDNNFKSFKYQDNLLRAQPNLNEANGIFKKIQQFLFQ